MALFVQERSRTDGVLIVRVDAIGDFVMWLDAAKEYRKIFFDKTLVLLANDKCGFFAETSPYWDMVWLVDRKKFYTDYRYRFEFLKRMRTIRFMISIQPTYSRDFFIGDSITLSSNSGVKIGYSGDSSNTPRLLKRLSDMRYSELIESKSEHLMELIRNADFVRKIGLKDFKAGVNKFDIDFSLISDFYKYPYDYCIIFPGGSHPLKRWPIEKYYELAKRITEQYGIRVVCLGAEMDDKEMDEARIGNEHIDFRYNQRTDLKELAYLISRAKFIVSNDTSAVHIAASLNVLCVCILGGGHFERFVPYEIEKEVNMRMPLPVFKKMNCYGCNWSCSREVEKGRCAPCVEEIEVDDVFSFINAEVRDKEYAVK
ncbi:MAG: glycosyltransferase family 9 protein [Candidatus Aminicenantes bacterium]|nr:glycosyltransferase family 9 protein [Candidatus Aminicenantes bacterium]